MLPGLRESAVISSQIPIERRRGRDRRHPLKGLLAGHWFRRRVGGRRYRDAHPAARDWHPSRWLAVAVLVLALSGVDAFMTLTLMRHGAEEANPLMAPLIKGGGPGFAWWKMGLTASGTVVLTAFAHIRLFGRMPAGCVLYLVLIGYLVLVGYEWQLLQQAAMEFVSSGTAHPLHYRA